MILPKAMGSLRSPGEDLGGGVRDMDGKPSVPGRRPDVDEVDDPGE